MALVLQINVLWSSVTFVGHSVVDKAGSHISTVL